MCVGLGKTSKCFVISLGPKSGKGKVWRGQVSLASGAGSADAGGRAHGPIDRNVYLQGGFLVSRGWRGAVGALDVAGVPDVATTRVTVKASL